MVIEDDDDLRRLILELLGAARIDAMGFKDTAIAIEDWKIGRRPSLILLDLGLPVVSGEQFLRTRRQLDPELAAVPVIIVTARSHPEEELGALGVVEFFMKPYSPSALLSAVRRHLR